MSDKESKKKKNYANIQKGKKYFDLFPSGVVYKGKAKDYSIKKLFPKKN